MITGGMKEKNSCDVKPQPLLQCEMIQSLNNQSQLKIPIIKYYP